MWFGIYLVRNGVISAEQLFQAIESQNSHRPQIGELAARRNKLSMAQVFQVLGKQTETSRPFGEIATDCGFLTRQQLAELLLIQSEQTPSLQETLVRSGVLSQDVIDAELTRAHRKNNRQDSEKGPASNTKDLKSDLPATPESHTDDPSYLTTYVQFISTVGDNYAV